MQMHTTVTELLAFLFVICFYVKGAVIAWFTGGWWLIALFPPFGVLIGICDFIEVQRGFPKF